MAIWVLIQILAKKKYIYCKKEKHHFFKHSNLVAHITV